MILMFFTAYNGSVTYIPEAVAAAQSANQEAERIAKEAADAARRARQEAEAARERERIEREAAAERARQEAAAERARQEAAAERARREAEAATERVWKSFDTDMVFVQGGTFTMGCTAEQKNDCNRDETPTQEVTLNDFYIGKYEVTQAQWRLVMGNDPSSFKGDNLPVQGVRWTDVQEFINKLNQITDGNYHLPTEAEWEYAARGGNQSRGYKYSGSNDIEEVAWYENNSDSVVHPVGAKKANELGIHDMSGNVYEWVYDWYGEYSGGRLTNPLGPLSGSNRPLRGGSYSNNDRNAPVSNRYSATPDNRYNNVGFRLARRSKEAEIAAVLARIEAEATAERSRQEAQEAAERTRQEAERAKLEAEEAARERLWKEVGVSFDTDNMAFVQGGMFTMGCTPEQGKDCRNNEKPAHQVTLSDFYIGKYEVTQALWQKVMGNNPSSSKGDNKPVTNVSWNDVQEFIKRLNGMTGGNYRLPTEAEWEYTARGGSQSRGYKHSGSNNIRDVGWYQSNSKNTTHPVGTKKANELGIHDMSGNVFEWVHDWFWDYNSSLQTNPQGPSSGSERVVRGGSGSGAASLTRVSVRGGFAPNDFGNWLGFRLVRTSK